MNAFDPPPPPPDRRAALGIWTLIAALLLGPSLLVWIVRGVAFGFGCAPGPELCHGIAIGGGLRDTLNLAWFVGGDTTLLVLFAIAAAIAALFARRPLLAALSALVLPMAVLVLPTLAVYVSAYHGCAANESGVGSCALWGAKMGMSFHRAALAPWWLYDVVPYAFAAAIMLGLIGWMFCRERQS
jgi:hypothetical protein